MVVLEGFWSVCPIIIPAGQHYVDIFRRQATELVKRQGTERLWRVNLDDPTNIRTPRRAAVTFSVLGWPGESITVLNRREYLPAVEKAWAGLASASVPRERFSGATNPTFAVRRF